MASPYIATAQLTVEEMAAHAEATAMAGLPTPSVTGFSCPSNFTGASDQDDNVTRTQHLSNVPSQSVATAVLPQPNSSRDTASVAIETCSTTAIRPTSRAGQPSAACSSSKSRHWYGDAQAQINAKPTYAALSRSIPRKAPTRIGK